MEMTEKELMLAYLQEMNSFEMIDEKEVPPTLTIEAVALKCGLTKERLDEILNNNKNIFKTKNVLIKNRQSHSNCIFLTSSGVIKAKRVFDQLREKRVEFIDDEGEKRTLKMKEVKEMMDNFNISITFFDLFMRDSHDRIINLLEFIEPPNWKENIMRDHAFPEKVFLSNTSCIPFGGIFTTFGEPGIILPINKRVEVGVHPFGEGSVIRWMKRKEGMIEDAFYIEGKKGFEALTSGHSPVMDHYDRYEKTGVFKDEKEFRDYFEVLRKYDYSIIFSAGTAHGISMAGHIGTILAALAIHLKDGISFPFNGSAGAPSNTKLVESEKTPIWDFGEPTEARSIKEMLFERHGPGQESEKLSIILRKFITLSQVFERHWNSSFNRETEKEVEVFQKMFDLKEFSSGGACISSIFGSPVLINLDDDGTVSFSSTVHPELAPNRNLGLIIDRKGGIDNPRDEFMETFDRFKPLIELYGKFTIPYFHDLKITSGKLAILASKVILENQRYADPDAVNERKAICDLLMMQKGIYSSLGIENPLLEALERQIRESGLDIGMGHIGVGNSGTFFFCVPDMDSIHSLKIAIDRMNLDRTDGEKVEMVLHGSSRRYVFNIEPLMIVEK